MKPLNKYFDHTLLSPLATEAQIIRLCKEAIRYDFYSVCVNSSYAALAAEHLADCPVGVTSVVGFPLGASLSAAKAEEAALACEAGADEIDMVMALGALKDNRKEYVRDDIAQVAAVCYEHDAALKVIIESHLLTDDEIRVACRLAVAAGADFVKTSTGFSGGGATVHAVELMHECVAGSAQVKASGGIRDLAAAQAMIRAGADRIGASASVRIMQEAGF
ncbi:MAG: deoxyribose-phosphate aldolase [Eubacteriales bacterium]|jgi:deoxyribose-phosphate aldolase|nr:deoxyribose-phosphate aldolase [Eubacteriales bacterium]